jgi:hypothetical protein
VPSENILQRLERLIAETIRAGRYRNRSEFLEAAKVSSGYLAELGDRLSANPRAGMTGKTAAKLAHALGVNVQTVLTGERGQDSDLVDKYRERADAIDAARKLKFPEAAIQLVLKEDPGGQPSALYWFRRIEAESERVSPAADSGSHKI